MSLFNEVCHEKGQQVPVVADDDNSGTLSLPPEVYSGPFMTRRALTALDNRSLLAQARKEIALIFSRTLAQSSLKGRPDRVEASARSLADAFEGIIRECTTADTAPFVTGWQQQLDRDDIHQYMKESRANRAAVAGVGIAASLHGLLAERSWPVRLAGKMSHLLGSPEVIDVVDFGAGDGVTSKHARQYYQSQYADSRLLVTGMDMFYSRQPVPFLETDATGASIHGAAPEASMVYARYVLHHIPPAIQSTTLAVLSKMVRPDGFLLIQETLPTDFTHKVGDDSLHHAVSVLRDETSALGCQARAMNMPVPDGYRTMEDWKNMLETAGFRVLPELVRDGWSPDEFNEVGCQIVARGMSR